MAFTKDSVTQYSRPVSSNKQKTTPSLYKPPRNLADEWPEVFELRKISRQPTGKWDKGPDEEETVVFKDPRGDLAAEDGVEHISWCTLLAETWAINRNLAITLHGFRCMGTRLVVTEKGYVLRPEVSDRAWQSQEEYQIARDKYLVPYQSQLIRVLKKLH